MMTFREFLETDTQFTSNMWRKVPDDFEYQQDTLDAQKAFKAMWQKAKLKKPTSGRHPNYMTPQQLRSLLATRGSTSPEDAIGQTGGLSSTLDAGFGIDTPDDYLVTPKRR